MHSILHSLVDQGRMFFPCQKTCFPNRRKVFLFLLLYWPSGQAAEEDLHEVVLKLAAAERPVLIVGGATWDATAAEALGEFAKKMGLPVGASFRCQDFLDNRHSNYVGDVGIGINPALEKHVREADVILALGTRLGEITTSGYSLLTPPQSKQELIHIYADPSEIGRVYHPTLAIVAQPGPVIKQLRDMATSRAGGLWLSSAYEAYKIGNNPKKRLVLLKWNRLLHISIMFCLMTLF